MRKVPSCPALPPRFSTANAPVADDVAFELVDAPFSVIDAPASAAAPPAVLGPWLEEEGAEPHRGFWADGAP